MSSHSLYGRGWRLGRGETATYNNRMNYRDVITIESGKRGGKPCVRGMRITVYDVLSYLASGMSHEEILTDFPYLTENDILACLSYAADREHHLMVTGLKLLFDQNLAKTNRTSG